MAKLLGISAWAHELRPDDAAVALDYARTLELNDDLAGARSVLQASLKRDPHQFAAQLLLGQVYFGSGDANAALDQLEDAALLQPENVEAKTSLATVLLSEKKFADVVGLLEPLIKSSDNNTADVFALLAQAYAGLGRREAAQRCESRPDTTQGEGMVYLFAATLFSVPVKTSLRTRPRICLGCSMP